MGVRGPGPVLRPDLPGDLRAPEDPAVQDRGPHRRQDAHARVRLGARAGPKRYEPAPAAQARQAAELGAAEAP